MTTAGAGELQVFALGASREFGDAVAAALSMPLSSHEEREFEDGEHKSRSLESVRGRDVFVLQSLYGGPQQSVDDKLVRLLFFLGALRDAGAARLTAVLPYLCYARKDRKTKARDPVTTRYLAQLLEAVGIDAVVTLEVHNLQAYQNAFRCPTEHLDANRLFIEHLAPRVQHEELVVVSPDIGGVKRAELFRQALARRLGREVTSAFVEKHRSAGVVSGEAVVGEVQDRVAIILDDLISTGGTLARAAAACRARGAGSVYALASHGVFGAGAAQALADPALAGVVITDTIPPFRLPAGPARDKLTVLSVAPLFAQAIRRMHSGGSLVELLEV